MTGKTRFKRAITAIPSIGLALLLAIVIGNQLSGKALAVLTGSVCGVVVAIPTSLAIVAVSYHRRGVARERLAGSMRWYT
ncbi:MAG: hypothetical protein DRI81_17575 [Chloroflexi bacterium]|nr:MAG: hypothetical protein DRI81_17575 [Chloroflexota bacterium]